MYATKNDNVWDGLTKHGEAQRVCNYSHVVSPIPTEILVFNLLLPRLFFEQVRLRETSRVLDKRVFLHASILNWSQTGAVSREKYQQNQNIELDMEFHLSADHFS